ncbi:DUF167 domain-containing protein [Vannielia litorea]|uniref:DUF167 domain-containing protein n=1 Tax=Vannielia litorea TaxID=1217970 RepID=UPI001C98BB74|nr:DUF167 domain-containing protein [Vannielia litorea]MBY6048390.1 DUF167 domain-containing protein [Vannielia litorea]MBY6075804.1 DUF167 domain-containing protein [Vannielia litorea]
MAKPRMQKGMLARRATPGATFAVRVTPNARADAVIVEGDRLKITTTATPEGGKANAAVTKLLAHALGVAPSRLTLTAGATSRDKTFRLD